MGGMITETNTRGAKKGALIGGIAIGSIVFPLAIFADLTHNNLDYKYDSPTYEKHFVFAILATLFGTVSGAIWGSFFSRYNGKAEVLDCPPQPISPPSPAPFEFPKPITSP